MESKLYIVKKVAFENVAQHKDLSLFFLFRLQGDTNSYKGQRREGQMVKCVLLIDNLLGKSGMLPSNYIGCCSPKNHFPKRIGI